MTQHIEAEADRPAHKPDDEIEITPQMIEAGKHVLLCEFGSVTEFSWSAEEMAISVFLAMYRCS